MGGRVPAQRHAEGATIVVTCWPEALDAVEERLRRLERVVDGYDDDVPHLEIVAQGPVPEELVPRALMLIARSRKVEERALRALAGSARAAVAYAAGHSFE